MWSVNLNLQPTGWKKKHEIPLICRFWNIVLSADRIIRHWHSIRTGIASDVTEQMHSHTIMHNPPLVLSFVPYPPPLHFFQHPIHLTVLLSGLKVWNSQLIPLISVGVAVKARDWQLLRFLQRAGLKRLTHAEHLSLCKIGRAASTYSTPTPSDNTKGNKSTCLSARYHLYLMLCNLQEIWLKALSTVTYT